MDVSITVLELLRSKNRCLDRFLQISRDFLTSAENRDFSALAHFQSRRESTLKAIDLFDRKVSESVAKLSPANRTPHLIEAVTSALAKKDEIIHQILDVDLKIITLIEDEKSRLLKEISNSRKSKEILSKFKSTWINESGEELDTQL